MEGLIGFTVFIVALLVILATGTPVAVATGLIGVVGVYLFLPHAAIAQLGNIAFAQSASFVLVVVPLFVMMGEALGATTIGRDLFTAAQIWRTTWDAFVDNSQFPIVVPLKLKHVYWVGLLGVVQFMLTGVVQLWTAWRDEPEASTIDVKAA